jgi:dihydrofolate reductase
VIADDELHDFYTQLITNADLIFYGRVTYELLASYWPTATSDPSLPKSMVRFANALNPMPKIVFSNTLENVGWNTRVCKALIPEEINQLKSQPGRDLLLGGGAAITQTFLKYGLVDEFQLLVHPVTIGRGKALFSGIHEMQKMDFLWKQPLQSGVIALGYHPDGAVEIHPPVG